MKFRSVTYSVVRQCRTILTHRLNCPKLLQVQRVCRLCSSPISESSQGRGTKRILGIETSCDDTGAAVVDEIGNILGNALHSQTSISVALGGVLPPHARVIHEAHIDEVVQNALEQANVQVKDLDAVAVTVQPGMSQCLDVGLTHAKKLVLEHSVMKAFRAYINHFRTLIPDFIKLVARVLHNLLYQERDADTRDNLSSKWLNIVPMIPIHHMEAHALTARMIDKIDFPFLVLLVSGGHCLLAVAKDIDNFLVLGKSIDDAPGEAFDKVARRLKLKNLPECYDKSGGASIELMAKTGDISAFHSVDVTARSSSCNFSFSGIKTCYKNLIEEEERKQGIVASQVISNANDLCATFQYTVLKHLAKSVQRAFLYCELKDLIPEHNRTLVVSGGVACNQYIRQGLQKVCDHYNSRLVCPPPHLCTDNGIMIAWNGMEKLLAGRGVADDPESVQLKTKVPLGEDISDDVSKMRIKFKKVKLL